MTTVSALGPGGQIVDIFPSYDDAVTWLMSIGGYVGPVERRADAMYSVAAIGPHWLTRTSTFNTGYREAVRLAAVSCIRPCTGRRR